MTKVVTKNGIFKCLRKNVKTQKAGTYAGPASEVIVTV